MTAKLVAEQGAMKGLVLSFEEGEQWTIGRDPDECQLVIEDPSVSRSHLRCEKTDNGIMAINLSTTSPTLINEEEASEPKLLQQGDTIRIGEELFRFYAEDEAHLYETDEGETEEEEEETVEEIKQDSIFDQEDESEPDSGLAQIAFDVTESGRWLVKVVHGPNNGAEFSMQTGSSYLLGTDANSCDIIFHDNSVSRQHARITISEDDTVFIEDLNSRNGTLIDGDRLEGKQSLTPNMLVTLGTTSFVLYDREGEMQTIISPLLPSIVKALQKDEKEKEEEKEQEPEVDLEKEAAEKAAAEAAEKEAAEKKQRTFSAFILLSIAAFVVVVIGVSALTLFRGDPVAAEKVVNTDKILKQALAPFPHVSFSFNKATGKLLLIGHVLTASDKTRLLNNLEGIEFIRQIDEKNVVVDQAIWQEINQILAKNPQWRGIAIHSPQAGDFVISGYLQTRAQAERLWDYLNNNFPYLDLLERRIVVEEDVLQNVNKKLEAQGFNEVLAQMNNGELTLAGNIPAGSMEQYSILLDELRQIQGLRDVRNFVTEQKPGEAVVNISSQYEVTGVTSRQGVNVSVAINGKILSKGAKLDGMTITEIGPKSIYLIKEDIIYRIDYNQ